MKVLKYILGVLALLIVLLGSCVLIVVLPQYKASEKRYTDVKNFKSKGEVQMIAHRGLSGLKMENTLPAFEEAGKRSYYGIETDVHVTKDGKFIITHDDDLKRIVGLDWEIEETTFAELRALRFKDINGTSEEKTLYLPSLEEYISICKKYNKQAILELKNEMTKELVWEIAESIKAQGWFDRTTFISFSGNNLVWLREKYKDANAQFLTEKYTEEDVKFMLENKLDGDFCWAYVKKSTVKRMHEAGLKVNVWTVNGKACAALMKWNGVDYITSNILE